MSSLSNFWKDFTFPSAVDDILKRPEGFTLEDLLSEDEVVSDARNHKLLLVNYLSKPEVVANLVDFIVLPAADPDDEKVRFRYPHVAADLLAADVPEVTRLLYGNDNKEIDRLYALLLQDHPDNLLAIHSCRVLSAMFATNTRLAVDHLRTKQNPLGIFLRHLNMSPVYDLLAKIVLSDNAESIKLSLQLLIEENFTGQVIEMFSKTTPQFHYDAASLLIELITTTGGLPSPIAYQLQLPETVQRFFALMLQEGNHSGLQQGLSVITFIINLIAHSDPDNDKGEGLAPIVQSSINSLVEFKYVLIGQDPNIGSALPSGVPRAFGSVRLKIIELVEALVKLEIDAVDAALLDHDVFTALLQLFMEYHSNNFLHKVVEEVIIHILDGTNSDLADSLFTKSDILHKLIAVDANNKAAEEKGAPKRSHVSYALNMAEKLATLASAKASLQPHLAACAGWPSFVETALKQKKELEATLLGGVRPIRTEIPGGGEFGPSSGGGGGGYVDVTGMYDEEDDENSNSDEDDDSGEDEDEEDDDDLDLGDDADMDSDNDPRDYDSDKCEVLISKLEIEALLEVA